MIINRLYGTAWTVGRFWKGTPSLGNQNSPKRSGAPGPASVTWECTGPKETLKPAPKGWLRTLPAKGKGGFSNNFTTPRTNLAPTRPPRTIEADRQASSPARFGWRGSDSRGRIASARAGGAPLASAQMSGCPILRLFLAKGGRALHPTGGVFGAPSCTASGTLDSTNLNPPALPRTLSHRTGTESNPFENVLFRDALVRGNGSENRIQRSNSEGIVSRDDDPVRRGLLGLQNYVAANLMDSLVSPALAEVPDQLLAAC